MLFSLLDDWDDFGLINVLSGEIESSIGKLWNRLVDKKALKAYAGLGGRCATSSGTLQICRADHNSKWRHMGLRLL